jgi:hypothetical protein
MISVFLPLLATGQDHEKVTISGTVEDYRGQAIDSAHVMLLSQGFQPVSRTMSDANGHYSMKVDRGNYYGMAVVNMNHYKKSRLEFWAWNIPAHEDIQIDARYDRMEVYALNAFRPQGGFPSYILYFRPMSLTKVKNAGEKPGPDGMLDMAPDLDSSEINVEINREKVKILSIQKVREFVEKDKGESTYMWGYLVQVELPGKKAKDYRTFRVEIHDRETGDRGEAIYYDRKNDYIGP